MTGSEQGVPPAITEESKGTLVLWAESPEEARTFLEKGARTSNPPDVEKIFVAKRSGKTRTNKYIAGQYWPTSDDEAVDVFRTAVLAPPGIVSLVQWCTCDVMLSRGVDPIVVVEDTTHMVRMNLFQRYPRLARAASLGVPSAILQGTRGLDLSKRGDVWGLHRFLASFAALSTVFPNAPTLPIWYEPRVDGEEEEVEQRLMEWVALQVRSDYGAANKIADTQLERIQKMLAEGVNGEPVPDIPSIDHTTEDDVVVRIGASPDVKSWREKGSGQMDPYVGMILAAKYLYCFNEGTQVRRLRVDFTKLPPDFWFFKDGAKATALYKRLPIEFPDEVRFLG